MFIEHKTVAYVAVFLFAYKEILAFLFDISLRRRPERSGCLSMGIGGKY